MHKSNITITSITKGSFTEAWDNYVEAHEEASIYHLSIWQDLIEKVFGHQSHYLLAQNNSGGVVGVLPLVQLKSHLFGNYMVSLPYFNYGGVLADDEQVKQVLLDKATEIAKDQCVDHIESRDLKSLGRDWKCRQDKVLMYLALPDTENELWKALGSKCRAQIKRLDREDNIEIIQGGAELVDEFYAVFARNMRDLGTPV